MAKQNIGERTYSHSEPGHETATYTSRFTLWTDANGRKLREYPIAWPPSPGLTPEYVDGDWQPGKPWNDGALCAAASDRPADLALDLVEMWVEPDGTLKEIIAITLDGVTLAEVLFVELPAPVAPHS